MIHPSNSDRNGTPSAASWNAHDKQGSARSPTESTKDQHHEGSPLHQKTGDTSVSPHYKSGEKDSSVSPSRASTRSMDSVDIQMDIPDEM